MKKFAFLLTMLFLTTFTIQAQNSRNPINTELNDLIDGINDGSSISIGFDAGISNLPYNHNIFIGNQSGQDNKFGQRNVAVGRYSMRSNYNGSNNTAIGYYTLRSNQAGHTTVAIGTSALMNNTQGYYNTACGASSMNQNTTGIANTATGTSSLSSNTTGGYNTALGFQSLISNTNGYYNTAVGNNALSGNFTGNYRTALGSHTNITNASYHNSTALGYNSNCTNPNQIRIGNYQVTSIGGYVNWTNISDARFKTNVSEDVAGLDFINDLRPVTYHLDLHAIDNWWLDNYGFRDSSLAELGYGKETIRYTGFIAQEVEDAARENKFDFSGIDAPEHDKDFYGLRYAEFVVPLVKSVQELSKENETLKAELNNLHTEIQALKQLINGNRVKLPYESKELLLFPNPATNTLNIQTTGNEGILHFFNDKGQMVFRQATSDRQATATQTIDISQLLPGIYYIKTVDGSLIGKFIKQ